MINDVDQYLMSQKIRARGSLIWKLICQVNLFSLHLVQCLEHSRFLRNSNWMNTLANQVNITNIWDRKRRKTLLAALRLEVFIYFNLIKRKMLLKCWEHRFCGNGKFLLKLK